MDPLTVADETAKAQVHAKHGVDGKRNLLEVDFPRPRDQQTVFYLAYGSNLAAETFRGRRNIHPLSAVNVVIPSLRLSFDLPGIAYSEPCFANSATRDGYEAPSSQRPSRIRGTSSTSPPYHKDRWRKGLVGVAYELTPSDYAHVLATEGGGSAYQDVVVDCFVLPKGTDVVPEVPTTVLLKAHTLLAPARERAIRPDPSYAQPSARYLKLITDGAMENELPSEYREFLAQIRPYRITTRRQKVGQYLFIAMWTPVIGIIIRLIAIFSNKNGKAPQWLADLASLIFSATWNSYDGFFFHIFGDGERTEGEGPEVVSRAWHINKGSEAESLVEKNSDCV